MKKNILKPIRKSYHNTTGQVTGIKVDLIITAMKRNAFTLIELLVVIAIIAILAAILFPVFAQAKVAAKKTQGISNIKNLGTASQIYLSDYDDTYGLSTPLIPGLGYAWDRFIPLSEIVPTTANGAVRDAISTFYYNALNPYVKNRQILKDPMGISQSPLPAGAFAAAGITTIPVDAPPVSYTFNGLLEAYSATSIANPSSLVIWWPGQGKRALQGAGYSSPQLICNNAAAGCRYVPGKPACGTTAGVNGESSFYTRSSSGKGYNMYSGTTIMSFADSHAKARRVGINSTGPTDPRTDPFALYNGEQVLTGTNASRYWDANYCHGYLFRPDFDFQTWDTVLQAP